MIVFLDSNILYSASHSSPNDFEALWRLPQVEMVNSPYCVNEVSRNLRHPAQKALFRERMSETLLVEDCPRDELPALIMLPAKDLPVLAAALRCSADILLTGDANHFGRFFGHHVGGVLVENPALFWKRFR